tara:strand:- start:545 stop:913 length:369 start_codon:yes stop_codon:yes gene_type:complete
MNTELNKVYDKIACNSIKNDPFESGGYVKKDFSITFFQSVHLHSHIYAPPYDFYLDIINFKNDILFCFHSHINNEEVSENDLKFIKVYNLDSLIYIIDSKKFLSVNTKYEKNYFSWDFKSAG